ncbi:unnamed protein product [Ilex paraguariensis]|uniref:Probable purine permease n=1 Tax=Ilex paraguariensis TaxID=185542 RepID=A0ABC8SPI5_9AQUA
MPENEEAMLLKDETSFSEPPLNKLKLWQWWLMMALNIFFLLSGQASAVLLGRSYYDHGGNCVWMATLVQTAAFPILLIPYFLLPSSSLSSSSSSQEPSSASHPPSITTVSLLYLCLGILYVGDNLLYSVGLMYLSASTYSLICATQLAFNAVFSVIINHEKFTALLLNSVVVLSFSASLIGVYDDSDGPTGVSKTDYVLGFLFTLGASALNSLVLSLIQLSFEKVLKNEAFSVVLEMQIYISAVATCASVLGLFVSGEWRTLQEDMNGYDTGKVSYVMTLVWAAVAWQVSSVGIVGLIFVVSSLFSNVISTLSLSLTPIVAVIVFHDKMNGVKVISLLMALWGFVSYMYQNYLDDVKAKKEQSEANCAHDGSSW